MSSSDTIDGYVVLKVKYKPESTVVRHVFIKENVSVKDIPQKPNGKTLLAINIPPFVDEYCIQHLFGKCGKIVNIFFETDIKSLEPNVTNSKFFDQKEIVGYKLCYIVFTSHSAVKKALNLNRRPDVLTFRPTEDSDQHLVGLKKMKQKYNESIICLKDLQKEINEFMADYDKQVEEEKLKAKKMDGVADEEGWITVTKYSKKRHLPNNFANDTKIAEKHNKRRKKSTNELTNFYKFQIKDKKFENLKQLKDKFEDDKKKLAAMKTQRKFRPV